MSKSEAANGYTIATAAALGHFASASPETRICIFLNVVAYVQAARAMDGLESLMLSGIDACHVAGAFSVGRRAMELWNRLARPSSGKHSSAAVFLSASQRIGFIGSYGGRGLPQFGVFGTGDGMPGSVFSPGMPGQAMGRQIAGAIRGGFEVMEGSDFCHTAVKYGTAVVGGLFAGAVGANIGSKGGLWGAAIGGAAGGVAGFLGGLGPGKELAGDICAGSSSAGRDGQTVVDHSGDTTDQGTYIGEVDDPNFVSGGTDSTGDNTGSSSANSTYIGEADDPNFVSGETGSTGDSSGGSSGSGTNSGDNNGSSGGGSDASGGADSHPDGGMDNPETGSDEYGDDGVGQQPSSGGFFHGGYSVITNTFANQQALQGSVRVITPALYDLQSLPLLAESSVGTILLRPGLLKSALPQSFSEKGLLNRG